MLTHAHPYTQLVFLLPQLATDGQWMFWPIMDKELRGNSSALGYLPTASERYILLGHGNQVGPELLGSPEMLRGEGRGGTVARGSGPPRCGAVYADRAAMFLGPPPLVLPAPSVRVEETQGR